jgi:single-stranded-DNA-specific exonuclease
MFYVMLALRAELRERGFFTEHPEPNFADLLDLVALGTVADVVKLDRNNRILVSQGLKRMRAGRLQTGIAALFKAASRDSKKASAFDLGFLIGPRLNAAGRLADMRLGVECLLTDDPARALQIAQELDTLNRSRREIEAGMQEQALILLESLDANDPAPGIALFDESWHEGVVGILASRIKEKLHRPVFAFAPSEGGIIKGSGRSIPGLHLRDALDLVAKRDPDLLVRFGGHAMAAGVTVNAENFEKFRELFAQVAGELIAPADLTRTLETDGPLEGGYISLETARLLENEVWGQGFPAPLFLDEFEVEQQRILKEKHLKLKLRKGNTRIEAIQFNFSTQPGNKTRAAFRLSINEYMGVECPQLMVEYLE